MTILVAENSSKDGILKKTRMICFLNSWRAYPRGASLSPSDKASLDSY